MSNRESRLIKAFRLYFALSLIPCLSSYALFWFCFAALNYSFFSSLILSTLIFGLLQLYWVLIREYRFLISLSRYGLSFKDLEEEGI